MARPVTVNAQYHVAGADSLAASIAGRMRRRMYERFLAESGVQPEDTILDIGATSDQSYNHSNYLEAWYARKERLTAVGIDDAGFLERRYPGLRFVRPTGGFCPSPTAPSISPIRAPFSSMPARAASRSSCFARCGASRARASS
jgi:hypothetical protein